VALLEQGKAAEAIPHLERTAAQQPGRWEPQQRLAEAYARVGDRKRATLAPEKARSLRSGRRSNAAVPAAVAAPVVMLTGDGGTWRQSTDKREDAWFQESRTPEQPDKEAALPGPQFIGNEFRQGERDR